ncbi:hypothetical protein [Leeuwenhoekiella sp. CH_XMU1409-2]|uniref:hypothetical protein n=1 Tax=Leeuwenhoekiella sp. CH_XMU1409-2 TaxID=3107768 RepID=UPI00300BAA4E
MNEKTHRNELQAQLEARLKYLVDPDEPKPEFETTNALAKEILRINKQIKEV